MKFAQGIFTTQEYSNINNNGVVQATGSTTETGTNGAFRVAVSSPTATASGASDSGSNPFAPGANPTNRALWLPAKLEGVTASSASDSGSNPFAPGADLTARFPWPPDFSGGATAIGTCDSGSSNFAPPPQAGGLNGSGGENTISTIVPATPTTNQWRPAPGTPARGTANGAAAATLVSPIVSRSTFGAPGSHNGNTSFPMYASNPVPWSLFGQRLQPVVAPGLLPAALENGTPMEVDAAPAKTYKAFIDPVSCANFFSLEFPIRKRRIFVQGANGKVRFDDADLYSKCEDKAVTSMGLFYTDKSNGDDKAVKKAVATFLDEESLQEVADDLVTFAVVVKKLMCYASAFGSETSKRLMAKRLRTQFWTSCLEAWLDQETFQTALITGFSDPKAAQERYQVRQNLQRQFWTEMQNNTAVSNSDSEVLQMSATMANAVNRQSQTIEKQSADNAANTLASLATIEKQSADNAANTLASLATIEKQSADNAGTAKLQAQCFEKVMLAAFEMMSPQKRSRSEDENTSDDSEKDSVSEPAAPRSKKRRV